MSSFQDLRISLLEQFKVVDHVHTFETAKVSRAVATWSLRLLDILRGRGL